ncbi:MAG: hypothetical protein V2A62_02890 [Candidatus Woesearchaeota archaeon]
MATSSLLCQLNGGCMGCCGHDFLSKEKMKEAIEENSQEFRFLHPQTREELVKFRERFPKICLRNGVCYNLVRKNGQLFCPLHPTLNNGKDLREGHCDLDHLCDTAIQFNFWEKEKQTRFLLFLETKKLDNVDYSFGMGKGSLLMEFNGLKISKNI